MTKQNNYSSVKSSCSNSYLPYKQILDSSLQITEPEFLDCIKIQYRGINVDVYGVLHALTGGTNHEYLSLVNRTIAKANGSVYSEKEMKMIYQGIDFEVDDWVQLPIKDALFMVFWLTALPNRMFNVLMSAVKEKLTKRDRFKKRKNIDSIGGSAFFHLIHPHERRLLAGFPNPPEYLARNLARRNGEKHDAPKFADTDWKWLEYIEPYGNIPCRSIHMIEFAVEHAIQTKQSQISLFVGEIHNSDIDWYVNNQKDALEDARFKSAIPEIVAKARKHAIDVSNSKSSIYRLKQRGMVVLGAVLPMTFWLSLITYLMNF